MSKLGIQTLFHDLPSGKVLWVADENAREFMQTHGLPANVVVLSNRFDVAELAKQQGLVSIWNDFDLADVIDGVSTVLYRTSKEKPVVHHVINQVAALLPEGGQFRLMGENSGGIKTYQDKTRKLFSGDVSLSKDKGWRLAVYEKTKPISEQLPNKDYAQLRPIYALGETEVVSKPGAYGWDKQDKGSALLVEALTQADAVNNKSVLDLGCGYGFLALHAQQLGAKKIVATDNNAAALAACQANFHHFSTPGQVLPTDAGEGIQESFEVVICNPPFHQGFKTEGDLTDRFLQQAKRRLFTEGEAWFVVNEFIPLAKKAQSLFASVEEVLHEQGFKVFRLAP